MAPPFWHCELSGDNARILEAPVSDREIFEALKSLKPYKAPGPDGLHAGFFQRFWLIVGNLVKEEVKHIFSTAKIPGCLKETLITLIPKCKCPESINNFQPISLCNSIYKVMTKVIVARIRPLFNGIISPFQYVFVLGRKGIDNAIIVQELIHSMARKRGNSGVMAIKIDLECL